MLPHHQRSLGRDWTTPWENLQRCCWNRHISSCMRWPGHYSRAPYPYFSSRHFSLNWRPPCWFESRTQFQYWNWRPDSLSQTSLIHLSSSIMNSEGDEPSSKRRKRQGKGDIYLGAGIDVSHGLIATFMPNLQENLLQVLEVFGFYFQPVVFCKEKGHYFFKCSYSYLQLIVYFWQ